MFVGGGSHDSKGITRRGLLKLLGRMAAFTPFAEQERLRKRTSPSKQGSHPPTHIPEVKKVFSDQDDALLQELEASNFHYFWDQTNPETGIVRDRCNVRTPDKSDLGSIAATGFGLTALCIGDMRGFISHTEAKERVLNTLRF